MQVHSSTESRSTETATETLQISEPDVMTIAEGVRAMLMQQNAQKELAIHKKYEEKNELEVKKRVLTRMGQVNAWVDGHEQTANHWRKMAEGYRKSYESAKAAFDKVSKDAKDVRAEREELRLQYNASEQKLADLKDDHEKLEGRIKDAERDLKHAQDCNHAYEEHMKSLKVTCGAYAEAYAAAIAAARIKVKNTQPVGPSPHPDPGADDDGFHSPRVSVHHEETGGGLMAIPPTQVTNTTIVHGSGGPHGHEHHPGSEDDKPGGVEIGMDVGVGVATLVDTDVFADIKWPVLNLPPPPGHEDHPVDHQVPEAWGTGADGPDVQIQPPPELSAPPPPSSDTQGEILKLLKELRQVSQSQQTRRASVTLELAQMQSELKFYKGWYVQTHGLCPTLHANAPDHLHCYGHTHTHTHTETKVNTAIIKNAPEAVKVELTKFLEIFSPGTEPDPADDAKLKPLLEPLLHHLQEKKFVTPACGGIWQSDFSKAGQCQLSSDCIFGSSEVQNFRQGPQCSQGGHWIHWMCLLKEVKWDQNTSDISELKDILKRINEQKWAS